MNSFTSISDVMKKVWLFPILVPVFGVIVFLLWNGYQCLDLYLQAEDGTWYEEKVAKMLLMETVSVQPDIVFVGSSRTMNQIDTAYLTAHGMKSFNLGLAGRWWQEYPSLVEAASRTAATAVVISIPVEELFRRVRCPEQFTIFDAIVFGANKGMFDCRDMTYSDLIVDNLPMNRFKTFVEKRKEHLLDEGQKIDIIKKQYGYDLRRDSRRINYIRGKKDRYTVVFTNGDGLVFSDHARRKAFRPRFFDLSFKPFNAHALKYMRFLAGIVASHDKIAVFVIEPSAWDKRYRVNASRLTGEVKPAYAFANAELKYGHELWSDFGHLNYQGVRLYTKYLHGQLRELLNKVHAGNSKQAPRVLLVE